jgi:hypothetical protein
MFPEQATVLLPFLATSVLAQLHPIRKRVSNLRNSALGIEASSGRDNKSSGLLRIYRRGWWLLHIFPTGRAEKWMDRFVDSSSLWCLEGRLLWTASARVLGGR